MADFGEICPLFDTGVFKEVMFPFIPMSAVTLCGNAFLGTLTFSKAGYFTFGRTVVVTDVYIRNRKTVEGATRMELRHHTSETAAGTVFASKTISTTGDSTTPLTWFAMTTTDKTFTSNDLLGFSPQTGSAQSAGVYDLILRYKEK